VSETDRSSDILLKMMTNDELLDRYVKERAQSAFADLVRRHLDLVYSTALRHVRSPHLAEEVAQSVFIDLARQSERIKPGTPLVAWLHVVARRTAVDMIRKEARRRSYEDKAARTFDAEGADGELAPPWSEIEPIVDEAMETLKPIDRAAILLRFFQDKSFQEVAAVIGSTDDAAQKRVSRALDQVRRFLTRRGVVITAAALSSRLATNSIQAAPASLYSGIVSVAASKVTATFTVLSPLSHIAMTTAQKVITGMLFTAAIAGGVFQAREISRQNTEIEELRQRAESFDRDLRLSRAQREAGEKALTEMSDALKSERLKTASFASPDPQAESALDAWLQKVVSLKKHLKENPRYQIPELALLEDKDWLDATKDIQLEDEWDYRSALSRLRSIAKQKILWELSGAIPRYVKASNGARPQDPSELDRYMEKSVDPAIWKRYKIVGSNESNETPHITGPNGSKAEWVITDKALVDDDLDTRSYGSEFGVAMMGLGRIEQEVYQAHSAFKAANSGQRPTTAAQLAPYLKSKIDPVYVEKRMKKIP
jgi:RNA polymerase sigma factor (sigma-70 family)